MDETETKALRKRKELLMQALEGLKERERASLVERHLRETPAAPEILSQQYDVARERIRQIEVCAFEKP